jgi:uncharacterized membrane protein (UPF0136 family)
MNLYWLIYGVLLIVGGIIGFVKAKSKASLIAGTISGVLVLLSGYWIEQGMRVGLIVGHLVSLLLFVRFGMAYVKTKKPFPSLMIIPLAVGGVLHTLYLVTR